MPKDKPREINRHDVWLTNADNTHLEAIADEMKRRGIDPNGRYGKLNPSKVIRWSLEQTCQLLENSESA